MCKRVICDIPFSSCGISWKELHPRYSSVTCFSDEMVLEMRERLMLCSCKHVDLSEAALLIAVLDSFCVLAAMVHRAALSPVALHCSNEVHLNKHGATKRKKMSRLSTAGP